MCLLILSVTHRQMITDIYYGKMANRCQKVKGNKTKQTKQQQQQQQKT